MVASIVHVDQARGELIVQHGGLPMTGCSLTGSITCVSLATVSLSVGRPAAQVRGEGNSGVFGPVPHHES